MYKKLFVGLLLLLFTGLVPTSCFFKCEVPDHALLQEFSLFLSEPVRGAAPFTEPVLANGARTIAAALFVSIGQLKYDYVSAPSLQSLFANQALAFSCPPPGRLGLKDQVETVTLTSKGVFNGVPAGQPLDQFVRCRTYNSFTDTLEFPLDQLPTSINKRTYATDLESPVRLRISPKPLDNAQQQFELRVRLQSGKELMQTTSAIIWE
ncbi:hypothetical protein [Hymenobacter fodinae]|uniref:Uncharacterized protein n=1 Tax=Hymenobacter fodinae TaxID=2510796 RepID=A0A4Z0NZI4_9BACT|nr:hypothetical protein [Hymenobacter fodinae]TGE04230.1 hypothetical protein EU556_23470 [Hymenobacter fodinae]